VAAVSECLFYSPQWSWLQQWKARTPDLPEPISHLTDKRFGLRQLLSVIIEELLRDGAGHFSFPGSQDPCILASWRHKLPVANAGD